MNSLSGELFSQVETQQRQSSKGSQKVQRNLTAAQQSDAVDGSPPCSASNGPPEISDTDESVTQRSASRAKERAKKSSGKNLVIDGKRERLLRRPEVEYLCGLSRSSLYRLITANEFPAAINLSKNAVAWLSSSIDEWIAARVAAAQIVQAAKRQER